MKHHAIDLDEFISWHPHIFPGHETPVVAHFDLLCVGNALIRISLGLITKLRSI